MLANGGMFSIEISQQGVLAIGKLPCTLGQYEETVRSAFESLRHEYPLGAERPIATDNEESLRGRISGHRLRIVVYEADRVPH